MNNCSFSWGKGGKAKNVLSDVTLSARADDLVVIVGKTGAGKSSLLLAMCSEVEMTQGSGKLVGRIAYLEQQPWIMNDTMRANILFTREFDENFYWKVLHACALIDDLDMWPSGDMTVIGEKGVNISGGQRARLALARTVYSKADIYFLDDPLSAVDATVKRHILDNIILSNGLLGNKLRFVTTNADNILPLCNQVVSVEDGRVSVKVQAPLAHTAFKPKGATASKIKDAYNPSNEQRTASDVKQKEGISRASTDQITITKPQKQWSHWSNTKYAIRICGWPMLLTVVITILFDKISEAVLGRYEIEMLKTNINSSTANSNAMLAYLGATTMSSIFNSLMKKFHSYINKSLVDNRFEQKVGNHLIRGLLSAPLSYFESKQDSKINSEHTSAISTFTRITYDYLSSSFADVTGAILWIYRITRLSPWLLVCIPLLRWILHMTEYAFEPLSRRIKELSDAEKNGYNRSNNFAKNRAQMTRLFGVEPHFTGNYIKHAESKLRLGMTSVTYSNLQQLVSLATRTALELMMLYAHILMTKAGVYALSAGKVTEYRLSCKSMGWELVKVAYLPKDTLYLLARINKFRNLAERDPEAPHVVDSCRPLAQWPPNGKIEFRDFSMKYGAHLNYALRNINLTINPGEKIGIVGRTGAGKSSLAKVLFRLIHENTSGSILIDGQDISEFGVGDYRPRLGMIPQESTMLDGSVRRNLDPLQQFSAEDMWASLIKCNMAKLVLSKDVAGSHTKMSKYEETQYHRQKEWQNAGWLRRMMLFILQKAPATLDPVEQLRPRGLDKSVEGCFGGFSSGQQQLFGLCRVIMRKRKIVVLDEATANVDLETDRSVQELIRKEFSDCTVLTIAHRLETIMKSDRIIVMDRGAIAETGTPQELLSKDGMFAQLVETSDFGQ